MNSVDYYRSIEVTGELKADVKAFYSRNERLDLYKHSKRAVKKGRMLSKRCEIDEKALDIPLFLHDIGRAVTKNQAVAFLHDHHIEVTPIERAHPGILHGRVSAVIAEELFQIEDPMLLDAIRYHTTLRPNPTLLEKLVFLSDKLSWTEEEYDPLIKAMKKAAKTSIDKGIMIYLEDQYVNREKMSFYHDFSKHAYMDFKFRVHKIYHVKKFKSKIKGGTS